MFFAAGDTLLGASMAQLGNQSWAIDGRYIRGPYLPVKYTPLVAAGVLRHTLLLTGPLPWM